MFVSSARELASQRVDRNSESLSATNSSPRPPTRRRRPRRHDPRLAPPPRHAVATPAARGRARRAIRSAPTTVVPNRPAAPASAAGPLAPRRLGASAPRGLEPRGVPPRPTSVGRLTARVARSAGARACAQLGRLGTAVSARPREQPPADTAALVAVLAASRTRAPRARARAGASRAAASPANRGRFQSCADRACRGRPMRAASAAPTAARAVHRRGGARWCGRRDSRGVAADRRRGGPPRRRRRPGRHRRRGAGLALPPARSSARLRSTRASRASSAPTRRGTRARRGA